MKLRKLGRPISKAEVTHVSPHGVWVLLGEKEYLLPRSEYPWFSEAKLSEVMNVEVVHGRHLRWPLLDVDLEVESLAYPEKYPLVYQSGSRNRVHAIGVPA